jgi:hypothetical protein
LALPASVPAQKEKKAGPTDKEIRRQRMQRLTLAYELADLGRKKDAPEYLITAAGILRQLSSLKDFQGMKKLDAKLEITGGGKDDKEFKPPSLLEQSDELFKQASNMGALAGVNVDKLIKLVKERETSDKEERGIYGGPRRIGMMIGPGQSHFFNVLMLANDDTEVTFMSNGPLRLSLKRADQPPQSWGNTAFVSRIYNGDSLLTNMILTIRITNQQRRLTGYILTVQ